MKTIISELNKKSVLIVGDLMLDHYLIGEVERISPEAPVPVVRVRKEKQLLGGAGNVAQNIVSLGGEAVLVSIIGKDTQGHYLEKFCQKAGVNSHLLRDHTRPTTRKTRVIAHNQQVVRVDHEQTEVPKPAVYDQIFAVLEKELPRHRAVILSDYGKGVISEYFMQRFMACVAKCDPKPVILVDPKMRNFSLYTGVDIITPNRKEAGEGAKMPIDGQEDILKAGEAILSELACKNVLITLGAEGMALFEGKNKVSHIPTVAQKVFDVTGAGDTVIATLALALATGADLLPACTLANYAAGIVVGQIGAATVSQDDLLRFYNEHGALKVSSW